MAASTAFFGTIRALTSMRDIIIDIDTQLTSIKKVLDDPSQVDGLLRSAVDDAQELGRTIDGVLSSMEIFSKMGFNAIDTQFLSKASMILSTVGEMEDADSANAIVAAIRQYKMEIQDATKIVDVWNEISNNAGTTSKDLADGVAKSGSAAANAGVDFETLSAQISTITEVLKISGKEAGNFLKTFYNRILRDTTITDLEALKVATKDANGELLSADKIIQNLSGQWVNFDKQTRNALAQQLGGVYHINKVSSLLENQERTLESLNNAYGSFGSAQNELEVFRESIQFSINQMKASWQELALTMGSAGGEAILRGLIDLATGLTNGFNDLTKATDAWNIKLPILAAGVYGLVKAFTALRLAATGAKLSLGWIGVGVVGLELLVSGLIGASKASDINTESLMKSANEYQNNADRLSELIKQHDKLKEEVSNGAGKQKELHDVLEDIKAMSPHLIEVTGEYGDTLSLNKKKADEYIESLKTMSKEELNTAKSLNEVSFATANKEVDELQKKVDELDSNVSDIFDNTIRPFQIKFDVKGIIDAEGEIQKRINELKQKGLNTTNIDEQQALSGEVRKLEKELRDYLKAMDNEKLSEFTEKQRELDEAITKRDGIKERIDSLEKMIDGTYDSSESLNKLKTSLGETEEEISNLNESIDSQAEALKELTDQYNDAKSSISSLTDILFDLNEGQGVTAETIDKVINNYPSLLAYIDDEEELRRQVIKAIEDEEETAINSIKNKLKVNDSYYKKVVTDNKDYFNNLSSAYEKDFSNYQNLEKAKAELTSSLLNKLQEAWGKYAGNVKDFFNENLEMNTVGSEYIKWLPEDQKREMLDAWSEQRKVLEGFDDITFEPINIELDSTRNAIGGLTREQDKNSKSTKDQTYVTDEYKNALALLSLELDKVNRIKSKYPEHSKEHRKAIEREIELTKQQIKLNKDYQDDLQKQIKTGSFRQTGMITKDSSSTTNSSVPQSLSGWGSKINSNYGMRTHPVHKDRRMHHGVDIDFDQGSKLQSNVSGTVKSAGFTSGGYGGLIEITDNQGRVHRYAHMNAINVSAGDTVGIGDVIGKTGGIEGTKGAGTSTGDHLHYEVRVNGKSINPLDFIEQAKGMKVAATSATNTQAEYAQSLDQTKQALTSAQQEELRYQDALDSLELDLINSKLKEYQFLREGVDRSLEKSDKNLKGYTSTSREYRDELKQQNKHLQYKQDLLHKEANHIREQLRRDELSARVKSELTVQLSELSIAWWDLNNAIKSNNKVLADSKLEEFADLRENVDRSLQRLSFELDILPIFSEDFRDKLDEQINKNLHDQSLIEKEISYLENLIADPNNGLLPDDVKKYTKDVSELRLEFMRVDETIRNITLEKLNSQVEELERELRDFNDISDNLNYQLEKQNLINPNDFNALNEIFGRMQDNERRHNEFLRSSIEQLKVQRSQLQVNSAEWDVINNKIRDMNSQLQQSNLDLIQNARDILNNKFKQISQEVELKVFDGKTEKQAREDFEHKLYLQGKYVEGAEKELEIAKIKRFVEQEGLKLTQEQQAILNSKDRIERASLERMQKQLDIQRLQMRLDNLRSQKTIQQLKQQEDGTWDYEYVADKDAIYETEQELAEKRVDLIKWEQDYQNNKERKFIEDKSKYMNNLNDLTQRALDGEFESIQEFYNAIEELNEDFFGRIDGSEYRGSWQEIFSDIKPLLNELTGAFGDYSATLENLQDSLGGVFVGIERGIDTLINKLTTKADEFYEAGNRIGEVYLRGVTGALEQILNDDTLNEMERHQKALEKMGEAYFDFAMIGDNDGLSFISDTITSELNADPLSAVEDYLQAKSSDFELAGDDIGESFVKGMIDGISPLRDQINSILEDETLDPEQIKDRINDAVSKAFDSDGFNLVGKEGGKEFLQGLKSELLLGRDDVSSTTESIVKSLKSKASEFEQAGDTQGEAYTNAMIDSITSLGDSPQLADVLNILDNALGFDMGTGLLDTTYITQALDSTVSILKDYSEQFGEAGNKSAKSYSDELVNGIEGAEGTLSEKQGQILDTLKGDLVNFALAGNESGQEFVKSIIDGVSSTNIDTELQDISNTIKDRLESSMKDMEDLSDPAGAQFVQGLINGIDRIAKSDLPNKADEVMNLLNKANEFGTLGNNLGESYLSGLTKGLSGVSGKMGEEFSNARTELMTATDNIISSLKGKSNEFAQSGNFQGVAYTESLVSQLESAKNNANATAEDIKGILESATDFDLGDFLGIESEFAIGVTFDIEEPEIPEFPDTKSTHKVVMDADEPPEYPDTESTHEVIMNAPELPSYPDTSSTHTINIVTSGSGSRSSSIFGTAHRVSQNILSRLSPVRSFIPQSFDTGGYTGDFGNNNGKLAFLHEKELVLNAKDTENMLKAIETTRKLTDNIKKPDLSKLQSAKDAVQQIHNHISKVEFPNVTNSREIEKAFDNLSRKALQYIPNNS